MFGISKQAYYKRISTLKEKQMKNEVVLQKVAEIRQTMPHTGTVKLWEHLRPVLPTLNIKLGRDGLNTLLRNNALLIRKTKRFHITTDSNHYYYTSPNRIKEIEINHAEQVFVTDITYIKTEVAERVNGIFKYEFGLRKTLPSLVLAKKMMKQAVEIYNNKRLHWSLDLNTPQSVHLNYNKQKYKSYAKTRA